MENIQYLYKTLLTNKHFYFCYLRLFLLFLSEKHDYTKLIKINLKNTDHQNTFVNTTIINDYITKYPIINKLKPKIFILNGLYIYTNDTKKNIEIKSVTTKNTLKNFFDYTVYNNLNFFYVLNLILSNNKINISFKKHTYKKNGIFILNIFNDIQNDDILFTKKNITFHNNSNNIIIDIYLTYSTKTNLSAELFLNIKKKAYVTYILFNNNSTDTTNFINVFSKQKYCSKLFFSDNMSNTKNVIIYYHFFLSGEHSFLQKISFKKTTLSNTDKRICNTYHYNNNTKSETLFGALIDKDSSIIFEGNIIVGTDIKKIEANLKCDGLLLSTNSNLEFKPNMFISNNDIKCTHGVSVGNIDNTIINYMSSRGLKKSLCKKILTKTFINKYLYNNVNLKLLYKKINNKINHE